MATFTSFGAYAQELKKRTFELSKETRNSLNEIGVYVRDLIREKHWVRQPWWAKGTNPTPLKKDWDLQSAVSYKISANSVVFYSKMNWLAVIHEYWCTFRMTDKQRKWLFMNVFNDPSIKKAWRPRDTKGFIRIPARPIRRVVLNDPEVHRISEAVLGRAIKKVFKK